MRRLRRRAGVSELIAEMKAEIIFHKQHPEMFIVWAAYFYCVILMYEEACR